MEEAIARYLGKKINIIKHKKRQENGNVTKKTSIVGRLMYLCTTEKRTAFGDQTKKIHMHTMTVTSINCRISQHDICLIYIQ